MDYSEQISKIRNDYFLTMLGYIALMIIALAFIIFLLIKIYQGTESFKVFNTYIYNPFSFNWMLFLD
jgi:hypothetical protein